MKHVYGNFLILILIISIVLGLSCGEVMALPQDWPCFDFELNKLETITDNEDEFEYKYKSETSLYTVEINLIGNHLHPNLFANCGTAGCSGIVSDNKTGKSENLRFFCESYSDNYSKIICRIAKGDEFIFNKIDGNYQTTYCSNNKNKILTFNKDKCNACHCVIYEKGDNQTQLKMGCDFRDNVAHCFSYNGYEEWRNFENNENDFKNCVNLISD